MQCIPYHQIIPYAAPSIGAFVGNSPLGVWQGGRTLTEGQGCPFCQTPINARSAGSKRHRVVFFWILFFVRTEKSISSVGTRTHIQITVALATQYRVHLSTSSGRTVIKNQSPTRYALRTCNYLATSSRNAPNPIKR
jgi:hypothetical protein